MGCGQAEEKEDVENSDAEEEWLSSSSARRSRRKSCQGSARKPGGEMSSRAKGGPNCDLEDDAGWGGG